ncbi:MAG: toxin-antitoxin system HicB family antitoxin [Bacillota bacterium]|nr:toxin-antitoxin system HicB family antitoxin [Bacillota bacterium]
MSRNLADVEYYMSLPYKISIVKEESGAYLASVEELPGCMTEGDSREEALAKLQDAMRGWIELALQDGDRVPLPEEGQRYSGRILVRAPKSLHRDLVERARRDGVSLNQYIIYRLSRMPHSDKQ